MSEICIHDWDFDYAIDTDTLYKCLKCGLSYDGSVFIDHINMLESDLANERALYAEKQVLIERLASALEELMDGFEIVGDAKLDGLIAEYRATVTKEEE